MSLNSFRVAIDLTSVLDDDRSWSYIYVEPHKFCLIRDLEAHLKNVFGFSEPVRLFIGKYFLPSAESVNILCSGDIIRVVGVKNKGHSLERNGVHLKIQNNFHVKKNSSFVDTNLVSDANPVIVSSHVDTISTGIENVCDQTVDEVCNAALQVHEPGEDVMKQTEFKLPGNVNTELTEPAKTAREMKEQNCMFVGGAKKNDVMTEDSDFSATIPSDPAPTDSDRDMKMEFGVVPKKRKRTRQRKRKMMLSSSVGEAISLIRSSIGTFNSNEKCHSSFTDQFADSNKHLRFSDDGDIKISKESDNDLPDKKNASNFTINRNLMSSSVKLGSKWDIKAATDAVPKAQNFVNLLSLRHKSVPLVFERKQRKQQVSEPSTFPFDSQKLSNCSSAEKNSNKIVQVTNEENVALEVTTDPNNYPVLNSSPQKHDVIVFKTLVLTENCIPQLSSYIMATVADFCPLTCAVKLQIASNAKELLHPPVKFSIETDASFPEDDFTTLNWNEIHETRLVVRAS